MAVRVVGGWRGIGGGLCDDEGACADGGVASGSVVNLNPVETMHGEASKKG